MLRMLAKKSTLYKVMSIIALGTIKRHLTSSNQQEGNMHLTIILVQSMISAKKILHTMDCHSILVKMSCHHF